MDLTRSARSVELGERLNAFMAEHVYPNERRYHQEAERFGRWAVFPVVEELKPPARHTGLWNLRLPAGSLTSPVDPPPRNREYRYRIHLRPDGTSQPPCHPLRLSSCLRDRFDLRPAGEVQRAALDHDECIFRSLPADRLGASFRLNCVHTGSRDHQMVDVEFFRGHGYEKRQHHSV